MGSPFSGLTISPVSQHKPKEQERKGRQRPGLYGRCHAASWRKRSPSLSSSRSRAPWHGSMKRAPDPGTFQRMAQLAMARGPGPDSGHLARWSMLVGAKPKPRRRCPRPFSIPKAFPHIDESESKPRLPPEVSMSRNCMRAGLNRSVPRRRTRHHHRPARLRTSSGVCSGRRSCGNHSSRPRDHR